MCFASPHEGVWRGSYGFLTSALDGGLWTSSLLHNFTSSEKAPSSRWIKSELRVFWSWRVPEGLVTCSTVVQPLFNHCLSWVIPPHLCSCRQVVYDKIDHILFGKPINSRHMLDRCETKSAPSSSEIYYCGFTMFVRNVNWNYRLHSKIEHGNIDRVHFPSCSLCIFLLYS